MNRYRITLKDGVFHYLEAKDKKAVRKQWEKTYSSVGEIKSIRALPV